MASGGVISLKRKYKKDICGAKNGFRKDKCATECIECDACSGQPPKCTLYPYSPNCCPGGQTPHHVVPKHCFTMEANGAAVPGAGQYDLNDAPCICVAGEGKVKKHGEIHDKFDAIEDTHLESTSPRQAGSWSYLQAENAGVKSVCETFPQCDDKCIRAQLRDYHVKQCKMTTATRLRADSTGKGGVAPISNTASGSGTF
ncbi:MAG: hypothetical protein HYZ57_21035 [Acidobacteria bacterium]|nr:hypothetical protein [Acidobacteriota bacterium]MBI3282311.1 hypothetical protein [Acidobacteriota bacterium]